METRRDTGIVVVRLARPDEFNVSADLHADEGEEVMRRSRARNVGKFLQIPHGERIVLFAEKGGKVRGSLQIELGHQSIEYTDGKTTAHLDDLIVEYAMRGQGIGTLLLERAEAAVREQGFSRITLAFDHSEKHEFLWKFYANRGYRFLKEKADGTVTIFYKEM